MHHGGKPGVLKWSAVLLADLLDGAKCCERVVLQCVSSNTYM
eukprot:CAMPEP_0172833030 /NCGR_PEP_ID=MMETSP1075-20121228/24080_1 /TAXON_ID=2916 /ORGANISM="Ceratium fusus, Strain PA161109" /LENGTH=41 /DNA_ID= /DNA_START= /DNA_END= /DNA_ORIENTATION=